MAYLDKPDYTISASILHVDEILAAAAESSAKTQDQIRLEAELTAQAKIEAFTQARYDIATEFAKTAPDTARSRMVIQCNVDIAFFYLHKTINPNNIPTLRINAFEMCLEQLAEIQNGTMALIGVDLVVDPDAVGSTIKSQRKFISKPFQDILITG